VVVVVEVGREGAHPRESPPHALFISLDLCPGRAGYGRPGDIVMLEMRKGAIDMIGEKRATWAAGAQHEVIDQELASAIEQLR